MAKGIRRNIRQLLHKEYAPINNRSCHEKLGELLIEKNRVSVRIFSHLVLLQIHFSVIGILLIYLKGI